MRLPVERHDRAQVDDHDADAVLLRLLRRQERPLHQRAPRQHQDVGAFAPHRRLAERHHVVGAGILALVVGLAVEMLVLEEEHRVVAADRRAQQAGRVLGVRRKHDADPGAVREDALARLAVVRRAAAQIAADGGANDDRARERVVRSIPDHRQLVANLHHRRPDVVEELDLDDRLQSARGHADGAADDVRLRERRVEHAIAAEGALQPVRDLEDAALARDRCERVGAAAIGDVLAEDDDARIARHLVLERAVDRGDHRVGLAFGRQRRRERVRRRIDGGRVHVERRGIGCGLRCRNRAIGRVVHFPIDVLRNRRELVLAHQPLGEQQIAEPADRIARRFRRALGRRLVQLLVVRERVGVGTGHFRVHERRAFALARIRDRVRHRPVAGGEIRAVHALHEQAGERRDEPGDVTAGGLHLDRHGDRVAVVLDDVDDRQAAEARRVQRLPELSLAGRAVADREIDDLVLVETRFAIGDRRDPLVDEAGLSRANRLQALRSGRARLRDDVEILVAPVRRHLPSA